MGALKACSLKGFPPPSCRRRQSSTHPQPFPPLRGDTEYAPLLRRTRNKVMFSRRSFAPGLFIPLFTTAPKPLFGHQSALFRRNSPSHPGEKPLDSTPVEIWIASGTASTKGHTPFLLIHCTRGSPFQHLIRMIPQSGGHTWHWNTDSSCCGSRRSLN